MRIVLAFGIAMPVYYTLDFTTQWPAVVCVMVLQGLAGMKG